MGLALACAEPGAREIATDDWREAGVCYEIFVRSFHDSDGDGIGDLEGVIRKLDYVNDGDPTGGDDLGARCIWLMPTSASPSYHGYDVTDYYRINPDYGTNEDFKRLVAAAHERGIAILVDMVINHASNRHPVFLEAARDPESPYREWFRWSPSPGPDNEYGDNNWRRSPAGEEYYYGYFSSVMPDLNWESEAVRKEMKKASSFWLDDMGADGLRLDAVRHLMEDEEGRSTNVPRTHDMLREYGDYIRASHPDAYTVGEVFDGHEALLAYYPDQLDSYFAFGISDAILRAVKSGSAEGLLGSVLVMQEAVPNDRYAPFLRNHDQSRTMTVLEGDVERAKLAATLLLTLPGVPFVYYGEELGMAGDKPDPRIRTPMPWTTGASVGFTTGEPWQPLQDDSLTANVQVQDENPESILNHYRNLIHLRQRHTVLGTKAELVPVEATHPAVVAYLRRRPDAAALVVANLGDEPLSGVTLSLPASVLSPNRELLPALALPEEEAAVRSLETDANGGFSEYRPLDTLASRTAYVLTLSGPE